MKALADPTQALADGLALLRTEYQVPHTFPADVLAEAEAAARRVPDAHVDRTDLPFVTLDPATSTDLDQAFATDADGTDLLLRYAIADVDWFVADGGAIDREAWARGETLYLPDGKAGLYPPSLSEHAASLLPDGPRPAVIFTVRVDTDGEVRLDGAERAIIRSRAKLAYTTVQPADLPPAFDDLARRIQAAEDRRGASRVDPPEQEVEAGPDGRLHLAFRPRLASETRNAALSLAANLAIADALRRHHTGLFRVMAEPDDHAVDRLRATATGLGMDWPNGTSLDVFERTLDPHDAKQAALMLAIRRAGPGASYAPYSAGVVPWHAAMAAPYTHATAPLRRLADRYVIRAALAVANGQAVPDVVQDAFARLPAVMARTDAQAGRIGRAVIDLAEAVLLQGREGERFDACVIEGDARVAKIQLRDMPVIARLAAPGASAGERVCVRLTAVDVLRRTIGFERC